MAESDQALSFEKDIRPLFRAVDIEHMSPMGVMLDNYEYMSDPSNAEAVHDFLTGKQEPRMPPGGPYWDEQNLGLLKKWISSGLKP